MAEETIALERRATTTAAVLKDSPLRRLELRVDARGRRAVLKIHRGRRGARRARREARALARLQSASVPCAPVLALDIDSTQGRLWLGHIESRASLEELFPRDAGERRACQPLWPLVRSAVELVRCTHDAGVFDRDLHAGNLLVGPRSELHLIDLHRSRSLPRALRGAAARRGLIRFLRFFIPFATPARLAEILPTALPGGRALIRRAEGSRRRLLRAKDRRSRGGHRAFQRRRDGAGLRIARRSLDAPLLARAEALLANEHRGEELKRSRHSTVLRLPREALVLKIFHGPSGRAARRRARRAWRAALALQHSRLPGAPALALWLGPRRAAMLCAEIHGPTLAEWIYRHRPAPSAQLHLARRLARAVATAHRDGLRLRDLRAENILLESHPSSRPRFIDLDGVAARSARAPRRAARDLARLLASFPPPAPLTTLAAPLFLRTYAGERGFSPSSVRRLQAAILRHCNRTWKRWRERGYRWDEDGIHDGR